MGPPDGKASPGLDFPETHIGRWKRFALRISHPKQVSQRHLKLLAWVGRAGWCGKAVVYASLGGLACKSAMQYKDTGSIGTSPQGTFILLDTAGTAGTGGIGTGLLVVLAICLLMYILWRFWEALCGQGYDSHFSPAKNFFKFRVSPAVSGAVYVSYMVFIVKVIETQASGELATSLVKQGSFPMGWRYTVIGRVGLAFVGVGFCIATCINLSGVLLKKWHADYREDLPPKIIYPILALGHIGFLGRAGAFLAMAALFFKYASEIDYNAPVEGAIFDNAFSQLDRDRDLAPVMFIIGFLLIVYGLFAVLTAYARVFPTLAPSRSTPLPAHELIELGLAPSSSNSNSVMKRTSDSQNKPKKQHRLKAVTAAEQSADNFDIPDAAHDTAHDRDEELVKQGVATGQLCAASAPQPASTGRAGDTQATQGIPQTEVRHQVLSAAPRSEPVLPRLDESDSDSDSSGKGLAALFKNDEPKDDHSKGLPCRRQIVDSNQLVAMSSIKKQYSGSSAVDSTRPTASRIHTETVEATQRQ
eukprot:jgi/Chrzof1/5687/Cz16g11210.t1